jgi:hypothetical protein
MTQQEGWSLPTAATREQQSAELEKAMTYESLSQKQGRAITPVFKTKLKPYQIVDGIPTFKDSELIRLLERAKEERLFPLVMYNVDPEINPAAFLQMYKGASGRLLWLVFYDDELAGWVWLDDMTNRTARSHFCLFRWVSKGKLSEEIGRDMFWQLFSLKFRNGVMLQVIRAEMPGFNKPGLWFLENIGLRAIGEIPNAAYRFSTDSFFPMVYLYATKDMMKWNFENIMSIAPRKDDTPEISNLYEGQKPAH